MIVMFAHKKRENSYVQYRGP